MKTDPTTPAPSPQQDEVIARNVGYFTLLLGFVVLTLSFLTSCNTTKGFGRDVQKAGSKIETTADRAMN